MTSPPHQMKKQARHSKKMSNDNRPSPRFTRIRSHGDQHQHQHQHLALAVADCLLYHRVAGLWLDDAELTELLRELARVLQPRLANPPAPGRKRRILGSVLLPRGRVRPVMASTHHVSRTQSGWGVVVRKSPHHRVGLRSWIRCRYDDCRLLYPVATISAQAVEPG